MRKTITLAVLTLSSAALQVGAHAQETLAGVGAASAMGATIGAAAAGSAISAGRATRKVTANPSPDELIEQGNGGGRRARGGTTAPSGFQAAAPLSSDAVNWGGPNGQQILSQLASTPTIPINQPTRSAPAQARFSSRVAHMSRKQRSKMVMAKYQPPAPRTNWLSHYLLEDRFKVTSGDWKFVSTETDRFYYRADAAAMLRQSPNRVIGFHSWQDAMIAGYQPDPYTKPTPGAEFAYMAAMTRGPQLQQYVEYAYAGQVTPENFEATYSYVRQAMHAIEVYPYAKPLRGGVIDKIMAATLSGNPSLIPQSVGGQITNVANAKTKGTVPGETSRPESLIEGGGQDKRMNEFDRFNGNAAKLAKPPSQQ